MFRSENRALKIGNLLKKKLSEIEPSMDGDMKYYPCQVTHESGRRYDCVYLVEEEAYIQSWGVYPEDDRGKNSIKLDVVVDIQESPFRLPAKFANEIYKKGESGMGYVIFSVIFKDGNQEYYLTGNAADFIKLPEGYSYSDIKAIGSGRRTDYVSGLDYFWCLYNP